MGVGGALAGRVALRQAALAARRRTDPELDPLYEMPGDVTSHRIPAADGGTLHVIERGAGRPLVLVHGITLQVGVWAPQLRTMADRYRLVALDVRGHGLSTAGSDGFGRRAAAGDLATLLEHLDLRDAIVVGHSMGGMILMQFAGDHPDVLAERVAGTVFMNTAAHQVLPPVLLPALRFLGRRGTARLEAGRSVPAFGDDDLSWVAARLAFGAAPSARAVAQLRRYLLDVPQSTSLPSLVDLFDHDGRDALAATRTPSLVLVGSRDLLTPVAAARRIAAALPDCRLEILPRAGHQLMQERPAALARLIDEFAAGIPG